MRELSPESRARFWVRCEIRNLFLRTFAQSAVGDEGIDDHTDGFHVGERGEHWRATKFEESWIVRRLQVLIAETDTKQQAGYSQDFVFSKVWLIELGRSAIAGKLSGSTLLTRSCWVSENRLYPPDSSGDRTDRKLVVSISHRSL